MKERVKKMTLIGVVPSGVEERTLSINQDYLEAVWRAGGTPVMFSETEDMERIDAMLDQVNGILLTGGGDIDPVLYGEEKRPGCGEPNARRDAMELPLCREAIKRRMPMLAICRGLQVLNCALGGTLYQDLAEDFGEAVRHPVYERPREAVHEVEVLEGTLLGKIVGIGMMGVNSRHHQGIKELGKRLRVSAVAGDGLIEGIEVEGHPFAIGVQWHPESLCDHDEVQQKIFNAFVKARP